MSNPLHVNPRPCDTCPYRRDTPPGIWHPSEYAKLPRYDDGAMPPETAVFLCHQSNATGRKTACRGWLTVAADSVAVRLAVCRGVVTAEQRDAPPPVPLYESGAKAMWAGMKGVRRPSVKARRAVAKLVAKGAGKA